MYFKLKFTKKNNKIVYPASFKGTKLIKMGGSYALVESEVMLDELQVYDIEKEILLAALNLSHSKAQPIIDIISLLRYRKEIAGINISNVGFIDTSRDSKSLISEAYAAFNSDDITSLNWKSHDKNNKTTWVVVDKKLMGEIYIAVLSYYKRCFDAEMKAGIAVSACNEVELSGLDIDKLYRDEFRQE